MVYYHKWIVHQPSQVDALYCIITTINRVYYSNCIGYEFNWILSLECQTRLWINDKRSLFQLYWVTIPIVIHILDSIIANAFLVGFPTWPPCWSPGAAPAARQAQEEPPGAAAEGEAQRASAGPNKNGWVKL